MNKFIVAGLILASAATISMAAAPEAIFKRCVVCHGKSAEKVPPGGTVITAKLTAEEIKKALHGYKDGTYGGKMKASMIGQVKPLSNEDIDAVADYLFTNFHISK